MARPDHFIFQPTGGIRLTMSIDTGNRRGHTLVRRIAGCAGAGATLMCALAYTRDDPGFAIYFYVCAVGIFTGLLLLADRR